MHQKRKPRSLLQKFLFLKTNIFNHQLGICYFPVVPLFLAHHHTKPTGIRIGV